MSTDMLRRLTNRRFIIIIIIIMPKAIFPTFSWAFVPINPMNVPTKFEVRSFTRSSDNRGYPKHLGSPWIGPRSLFSKIFSGLLFG